MTIQKGTICPLLTIARQRRVTDDGAAAPTESAQAAHIDQISFVYMFKFTPIDFLFIYFEDKKTSPKIYIKIPPQILCKYVQNSVLLNFTW